MKLPFDKAVQVVHLLCEGVGVRAAARLASVDKNTVLAVLETVGPKCARLMDQKMQWLQVRHVQIDELWAYVFCKQRNSQGNRERGDQYTYLAIDSDSKLIITYAVGKRDKFTTRDFVEDLRKRITSARPQISTDGFSAYTGHLGAVFQAFKLGCDYGSITKLYASPLGQAAVRYSPAICTGVRREVQIGSLEPKTICTSHVERQNLNMRLFNRRMTRLTLGYSKKLRNLEYAVALQVAFHNFCRKHSKHNKTPAHAHGLTDHTWTIEELLKAE